MSRFSDWTFRLRALFGRGSLENQVNQEFAFHVQMEAEKLQRVGWSAEAATAEARRRFGSETRERERARDAWGVASGLRDGRGRSTCATADASAPGFLFLAVITLGLGIGATTALFAVVYGLLVRPLPFRDEGLSVFWSAHNWRGSEYDHVRPGSLAFEQIAAYGFLAEPLRTGPAEASRLLEFVPATANLFDAIGVQPVLGRGFAPGEDRPGAERVVVISHGLWQQEFGGTDDVIGRRIHIGGQPTTIIGVMPRGFYFPTPEVRAWRPLILDPAEPSYAGSGWLALIGAHKRGVGEAEVTQELDRITRLLGERFTYTAAWDKTKNSHMTPVREYLLGDVREPLLLLMAAVGLLLVIACANAAALILARTTDRTTELAVRLALGANHPRIARQIVTESLVMATISAIVGAMVAAVGFQTLVASLPLQRGFAGTVSLGWQAFATAFALALAVGLGVAAAPVRQVMRGRLDVRERGEEGLRRGTRRMHAGLIAAQVTLAVMLVSGASLLIRSVERIRSIETGFDATGVVTIDLVREAGMFDAGATDQFYRTVLERVEAVPGVTSAGFTNRLPVRDGGWQGSVNIEGRPTLTVRSVPARSIAPPLPITSRRLESRCAQAGASRPPTGPTGRWWRWSASPSPGRSGLTRMRSASACRSAVPRSRGARRRRGRGDTHGQHDGRDADYAVGPAVADAMGHLRGGAVLVVKGTADPASTITAVRSIVADLDRGVAIARTGTMESVVNAALAEPLQLRFFLALFAALALLLGAVGVYGVVSYAVTRRRAEFGIRMALGAAPARVLGLVVSGGMMPVVIGAVAGVLASIGMSRLRTRFPVRGQPD